MSVIKSILEIDSLLKLYLECRAGVTTTDSDDNAKEISEDKQCRLETEAKKAEHIYYVRMKIKRSSDVRVALHKVEELALSLYRNPWKKELYSIKNHGSLIMNYLQPTLTNYRELLEVLGYEQHGDKYVLDIHSEMKKDESSLTVRKYLNEIFRDKVSKVALDLYTLQLKQPQAEAKIFSVPAISEGHSPHHGRSNMAACSSSYDTTEGDGDLYGRGDPEVKTNEFRSSSSSTRRDHSSSLTNNITNNFIALADIKDPLPIKSKIDNNQRVKTYDVGELQKATKEKSNVKTGISRSEAGGIPTIKDSNNIYGKPLSKSAFEGISDQQRGKTSALEGISDQQRGKTQLFIEPNRGNESNKTMRQRNEQQPYSGECISKQHDIKTTDKSPNRIQKQRSMEEKENKFDNKLMPEVTNEDVNFKKLQRNEQKILEKESLEKESGKRLHSDRPEELNNERVGITKSSVSGMKDVLPSKIDNYKKDNVIRSQSQEKKHSDTRYKGYVDDAVLKRETSNPKQMLGLRSSDKPIARKKDMSSSLTEETTSVSRIVRIPNDAKMNEKLKHTDDQRLERHHSINTRSMELLDTAHGKSTVAKEKTEFGAYTTTDNTDANVCVDVGAQFKKSTRSVNQCENCRKQEGNQYRCSSCEQLHPYCYACFKKQLYKCKNGGNHKFTDFSLETNV